MLPTVRVQQGPSQAAHCASKGIVPGYRPFFRSLPPGGSNRLSSKAAAEAQAAGVPSRVR